ncbi:MAG: sugar nucleotide-binding protein [Actinobacteria bacterium]|nr:sugar nucleotide-binding protein [Actinomycetota bacterium]
MVRVLVTGGTGYLGRVLVRHYSERGHEVHATWHRRFPEPRDGVSWHSSDLADLEATRQFVERLGPELVVHTAYATGDAPHDVVTARAPGAIAAASRSIGARLIHLSTDVVFDGTTGGYREGDPLRPVTAYGQAKADAEAAVAAADPGALIVRTSLLYGGGEVGPQEQMVQRALSGDDPRLAFFTDELRSVVQLDDLAAAIVELASASASGPLHVAGPEPVTRHEFAWLLARAQGLAIAPDQVPMAISGDFAGIRPKNCTLDSTVASQLLTTRLRGAREVLAPDAPTLSDR